ncbi:MAG: chemotaxis protein CheW, partial [Spirochaetales bacterium]|nr:chemotaxis protein CheW [Spirochaetales bacterium]
MADREVLEKLSGSESRRAEAEAVVERVWRKFIVAGLIGARYAIPAADVREIVIEAPIHYVPFVPPYVRGFVNRHGEPYTAVDLNVLFR